MVFNFIFLIPQASKQADGYGVLLSMRWDGNMYMHKFNGKLPFTPEHDSDNHWHYCNRNSQSSGTVPQRDVAQLYHKKLWSINY